MTVSSLRTLAVSVALAGAFAAHATTIDFDAQAVSAPSVYNGVLNSPLVIGTATFTGGQLLRAEINAFDQTGVYATTNFSAGSFTNPLQITFSSPVTGFSVVVTNNIADSFTVADNLGDTLTSALNTNAFTTFALAGNGITSVTIKEAGPDVNFAIENVNFVPATSVVPTPEPSTLMF